MDQVKDLKPLLNKLYLNKKEDEDYLVFGYYVSTNKCKIIVIRLDKDHWVETLNLYIETELVKLHPSTEQYCIYDVNTEIRLNSHYDSDQKIPKTIIQTENQLSGFTFKLFNPEYEYKSFNDVEKRKFIKDNFEERIVDAYDKLFSDVNKNDLFAYCYLYKSGGCYFDKNIICRQSLRNIIDKDDEILFCLDKDDNNSYFVKTGLSYLSSIIMSVPENKHMLQLINNCVNNILNKEKYFYDSALSEGLFNIQELSGSTLIYKIFSNNIPDSSLRFKFLLNNKIIDMNSKKTCFDFNPDYNHNNSWLSRNIFFRNKVVLDNLKIFVFPHPYIDEFDFSIQDNKLLTKKLYTSDLCWGLHLIIRIIHNDTSEFKDIHIGKERVINL